MGSVTMKTVAEHVGVSVATVSNAYSRPDQLSAELRDRILATADELGYCGPNATGRALRSGRIDLCGFLFTGELSRAFADPYSVIFLSGLSDALKQFGASILLLQTPEDPEVGQQLERAPMDALVGRFAPAQLGALEMLRRRGVRVVSTHHSQGTDWVDIDDHAAGTLVGRHLAGLGHRDVVVVASGAESGRVDEFTWDDREPFSHFHEGSYETGRLQGLAEELGQHTLRVVRGDDNSREAGRMAAARILDASRPPTAVVSLSDVMAFGVLDAARERGLVPGRDLSITGFDDIPDADFLGLTTVHQPIAEKGRIAGLLAMDADYPQRQVTLPSELVVRSSTARPPVLPHEQQPKHT